MSKLREYIDTDPDVPLDKRDALEQLLSQDPAKLQQYIETDENVPIEGQNQLIAMFQTEIAPPPAPEPTWGETVESAVKLVPTMFEAIPPAAKYVAYDLMGDEAGKAQAAGEIKQLRAYQERITPPGLRDPSFTLKSIAHGTISQLPLQVANLATIPLTGPLLGAVSRAVPLALMGAESAVQAYPEYREAGFSAPGAAIGAGTIGAIEVLTEKMGLDAFFKGAGGGFYKRMLNITLANAGEEGVAAVLQGTQNNMALRGMPFGTAFTKAIKQVPNAAGVGGLTGVALGGPIHWFQTKQVGADLQTMDAELREAETELQRETDPEAREAIQKGYNERVAERNTIAADWGYGPYGTAPAVSEPTVPEVAGPVSPLEPAQAINDAELAKQSREIMRKREAEAAAVRRAELLAPVPPLDPYAQAYPQGIAPQPSPPGIRPLEPIPSLEKAPPSRYVSNQERARQAMEESNRLIAQGLNAINSIDNATEQDVLARRMEQSYPPEELIVGIDEFEKAGGNTANIAISGMKDRLLGTQKVGPEKPDWDAITAKIKAEQAVRITPEEPETTPEIRAALAELDRQERVVQELQVGEATPEQVVEINEIYPKEAPRAQETRSEVETRSEEERARQEADERLRVRNVAEGGVEAKPAEVPKAEVVPVAKTAPRMDIITLPGHRSLPLFTNPTPADLDAMEATFRERWPNAPKGEPYSRTTRDAAGNQYVWLADNATHAEVEEYLRERRGVKAGEKAKEAGQIPGAIKEAEAKAGIIPADEALLKLLGGKERYDLWTNIRDESDRKQFEDDIVFPFRALQKVSDKSKITKDNVLDFLKNQKAYQNAALRDKAADIIVDALNPVKTKPSSRKGGTDLIDPVAINAFIDKAVGGAKWLGTQLESAYRSAVSAVARGLDYFTWAKDAVAKFGADLMSSARAIWRDAIAGFRAFTSVPGGVTAQRRGDTGTPGVSQAEQVARPLPPTKEQIDEARKQFGGIKQAEQQMGRERGLSEESSRTAYVEFNGRVENMLRDYGDTKLIADILKAVNLADVRAQMAGTTPGRLTRLANAGLLKKPGQLSWAAQEALGRWYGRPVDEIMKRKAGELLSLADQAKLELVLGKVTDMLGRVQKQTDAAPRDLDAQAVQQFLLDTDGLIASTMFGNASDASRAMNFMKSLTRAERNSLKLKNELNLRNQELTQTQVDLLNKLDKNSPNFARNIINITQITGWDKLYEYYLGNILSGIATNTRNAVSNIASLASQPIEALVARGIDGLRGAKHGRSFYDPVAIVLGWGKALNDAGKVAVQAFIEGDVDTLKLDNEAVRKLYASGEGLHTVKGEGLKKAIEGRFGYFVRLPSSVLRTVDAFFRTLASMGYLNMKVMRDARAAGLEPGSTKWTEFVSRNMTEPTEENLKAAAKEGAYRVFASTINNEYINRIYSARGTQTFLGRLTQLFMPFIKTPYNIFIQGLERSPIGLYWIQQGRQTGEITEAQVADELAKPIIGSMILGMGAWAVLNGTLTGGGPKDKGERERLMASGYRPYSLRIGKNLIGLDSVEPLLGTTLAMVADATEAMMRAPKDKGMEQMIRTGVTGTLEAILKNLHNKTFLRGLMSATDALSDPERYGGSFLESYARGAVPFSGFAKSIANMIDPTIYRVDSPSDSALNVFPMLSSLGILPALLPKLDWLGRTQLREPSGPGLLAALYRGGGPMSYSEISADPVDVFVNEMGIDKGVPSQHVQWRKQRIDLPNNLHNEYIRVQGQYAYRYLAAVAGNLMPRINTFTDATKTRLKERIERKIGSYRQKVLNQLIIKWKKEGLLK